MSSVEQSYRLCTSTRTRPSSLEVPAWRTFSGKRWAMFVFVTDPQAQLWNSLVLCEAELLFLLKHLYILKGKECVCVHVCVCVCVCVCVTKMWDLLNEIHIKKWLAKFPWKCPCLTLHDLSCSNQWASHKEPRVSSQFKCVIWPSCLMVYHNKRVILTALKLFLAQILTPAFKSQPTMPTCFLREKQN